MLNVCYICKNSNKEKIMLEVFSRLFSKKGKPSNIGYCQEKHLTVYHYFKFTKMTKNSLEKFVGDMYDYDFTDCGVIIWEERINCNTFFKSFYFPYNTYILRNKDEFKFIPIDDFERMYKLL